MIGALEGHPGVRVGLHYSGPLLEWLLAERPRTIERLQALVARGQGGVLGGGWARAGPGGVARARPERPAAPHERGGGAHLRAAAARGVAGRARLGALAAGRPGARRLRVDDPRRQPPAGPRARRGVSAAPPAPRGR